MREEEMDVKEWEGKKRKGIERDEQREERNEGGGDKCQEKRVRKGMDREERREE